MKKEHISEMEDREHHHDHSHGALSRNLFLLGLALYLISFLLSSPFWSNMMNVIAIAAAGHHVIVEGVVDTYQETKNNKRFTPNIHILMTLAAFGAMIIGDFHEAALLILIFAGAHFLEDYAQEKSRREISQLLKMNPSQARLLNDNDEWTWISVQELNEGDRLKVLIGDQVPIDGVIISGYAQINEASITGESLAKEKTIGDSVYASTINNAGDFIMQATVSSGETVFARIMKMVEETQESITPTAAMIKRIEPVYVTIILLLAPLVFLMGILLFRLDSGLSFYRTMIFLTVASPCALAATDIPATLSALSHLAKRGILFKGGNYLSHMADLKAFAFDKTGTLTTGIIELVDIYELEAESHDKYMPILVNMERKANHPLADSFIRAYGHIDRMDLEVENHVGFGLETMLDGKTYRVGKARQFNLDDEALKQLEIWESEAKTVVAMSENGRTVLLCALMDTIHEDSKDVIAYFNGEGITTVLISGDSQIAAQAIGKQIGLKIIKGNVLPEDKADIIGELRESYGFVGMLGDGINDTLALSRADLGIAMGQGSDVAIEVADAVIMKNDLKRLSYTHKLAKKLRRIVWQNIAFAMAVVLTLLILNFMGRMSLPLGVLVHEGSTLIVIMNGLRLLQGVKER